MTHAHPIRVVLADDHPMIRAGVQAVLGMHAQIQIVGLATCFAEAVELLADVAPQVLILDLGGMAGAPLAMVTRIRREYPQVAIVVFSSCVDLAPELLRAGVCGYVAKEEVSAHLLDAIHAARAGRRFLSPVAADYVSQTTHGWREQTLAPKELHVLKLLAQGLGTRTIATELGIDSRSVQNYITTLRRKIGVAERTQLVDWYQRVYG